MTKSLLFFGNIFVNSEENFLRMKDSYESIDKKLFKDFVINIRGNLSERAIEYFLSKGIKSVYSVYSNHGWFHDTYILTKSKKYEYIFCWLEDQICLHKKSFSNYLDNM